MSLEQFSVEQFRDWFVTGVQTMCGEHGDGLSQAFAPVANRIGYARESSWIDEVVDVIQALPEDQKQKCYEGVRQGLVTLANRTNDDNWLSLNFALEIARKIKAHGVSTIQQVAEPLFNKNILEMANLRQIFSHCALCLFETEIDEREIAKPLLMRILMAIDIKPKNYPRDRLIKFGIDATEIPYDTGSGLPAPAPI